MKAHLFPRVATICAALVVSSLTVTAAERDGDKATEGKASATKGDGMEVSVTDASFMKTAAEANLAEIKLAELATEKASAEPVKEFARMLVKDHTQAGAEMKALAKAKDVTLPKEVSNVNADKMKAIGKLEGADFDKAFMDEMHLCHAKDIAFFEAAGQAAADPDVKAFITKTVPVLKAHGEKTMELHGAAAQNH